LQVREQISDDRAISRAVAGSVVMAWPMKVTTMKGSEQEQRTRYLAMVHGTGCPVSMIGAERIQEAGQTPEPLPK